MNTQLSAIHNVSGYFMTKPQSLIITFLTLVIMTIACRQNKKDITIVEGDLFFRAFRYGSFYNQPDSLIKAFVTYADTVRVDSLQSFDKQLLQDYFLLKTENRLYSPFVELRINDSSIVKLYLDSADYDKIKIYKRQDLQTSKKKIRIIAERKDLGNGISICTKLISVDKLDGLTMQKGKKFKIDDYQ